MNFRHFLWKCNEGKTLNMSTLQDTLMGDSTFLVSCIFFLYAIKVLVPIITSSQRRDSKRAVRRGLKRGDSWINREEMTKSVAVLSPPMAYSLCLFKSVDVFHTLSLSFCPLLWIGSNNKLLYPVSQETVFCVHHFLSREVTSGSNWNQRDSSTLRVYLGPRSYNTWPKYISTMWNANSHINDCQFHFL